MRCADPVPEGFTGNGGTECQVATLPAQLAKSQLSTLQKCWMGNAASLVLASLPPLHLHSSVHLLMTVQTPAELSLLCGTFLHVRFSPTWILLGWFCKTPCVWDSVKAVRTKGSPQRRVVGLAVCRINPQTLCISPGLPQGHAVNRLQG